jgi:hypothetical protein
MSDIGSSLSAVFFLLNVCIISFLRKEEIQGTAIINTGGCAHFGRIHKVHNVAVHGDRLNQAFRVQQINLSEGAIHLFHITGIHSLTPHSPDPPVHPPPAARMDFFVWVGCR